MNTIRVFHYKMYRVWCCALERGKVGKGSVLNGVKIRRFWDKYRGREAIFSVFGAGLQSFQKSVSL